MTQTQITTANEAARAVKSIKHFIGRGQLLAIHSGMMGEERQYFVDKLCAIAEQIHTMPKTYEQDGLGDQAIVHLHYFNSGMDWFITERDETDEQHQAYGLADIGFGTGGEIGYISIAELIGHGVELDLHWTPKTLDEIKAERCAA